VISGLARRGRLADAAKIFDRMRINTTVAADATTYNTMVAGYASRGMWSAINRLFGQMREDGISPDQWTYGPLLEACRKAGLRQRARVFGRRMLLDRRLPLSSFCLLSLRKTLGATQLRVLVSECNVAWEDVEATLGDGLKPSQAKPSQVKSSQVKSSRVKSSQVKPSQAKPSQVEPSRAKSKKVKPSQRKSSQVKPSQAKSSQIKESQVTSSQVKSSQVKLSRAKSSQAKSKQAKSSQSEKVKPRQAGKSFCATYWSTCSLSVSAVSIGTVYLKPVPSIALPFTARWLWARSSASM